MLRAAKQEDVVRRGIARDDLTEASVDWSAGVIDIDPDVGLASSVEPLRRRAEAPRPGSIDSFLRDGPLTASPVDAHGQLGLAPARRWAERGVCIHPLLCHNQTMPRRRRRPVQLHLNRLRHGGRREGAGRPKSSRRVSHLSRPKLGRNDPVHVTLRVREDVPNLRTDRMYEAVLRALQAASEGPVLRVVHHSVQLNHMHLIVEVKSRAGLMRGMQGLVVRLARAINRAAGRCGTVFADRYHAEVLRTPRQTRHALAYVLKNDRHHLEQSCLPQYARNQVDERSSAPWFDGWKRPIRHRCTGPPPHPPPRTWLLRRGWRKHGLLDPAAIPGKRATARR